MSLSEYQWHDILRRVAFGTVSSVCKPWLRFALSDEQRWLRVLGKRCQFRMFHIADMIVPLVDRSGLAVRSLSAFSRHLRVAGRRHTFDVVRAHFIAGPLVEPAGAMRALVFDAQDPVHTGDDRILEPLHGIVDTVIIDRTRANNVMTLPWVSTMSYTPLRHYCVHIPSVQRVVLQLRDTKMAAEDGLYAHVTLLAVDSDRFTRALLTDVARTFPRVECLALRCDNLLDMPFLCVLLQFFPHVTQLSVQSSNNFSRRFEMDDDTEVPTILPTNRLQRLYIHTYVDETLDTAAIAAQLAPTADLVVRSVNEALPERCLRAINNAWAHMADAL